MGNPNEGLYARIAGAHSPIIINDLLIQVSAWHPNGYHAKVWCIMAKKHKIVKRDNSDAWKEFDEALDILQGNDKWSPKGIHNPRKGQKQPKRSGWWNK